MKISPRFFLMLSAWMMTVAAFGLTDTLRYTVLTTEKISGKQLVWSDGPNQISYAYQFNDRGRGPKIRVDIRLENGVIVSRSATGVDYFKGEVNEQYTLSNGTATWTNKIEKGSKSVNGPVLYSAMEGAPGEIELALRLLWKQPNHELDMLPAGKLKARHVKNHTARMNGFPEELEMYEFSGSGGPPAYLWLTPKHEFFAEVTDWSSIIRQGYEFLVPELIKLQDEIEEDYYAEQAVQLTHMPKTAVAFTHVNLFDANKGKTIADQTVIMENGKITQVGKAKKIKVPAGAKEIDGKGKMLLPGLWDNHAHYDMTQGLYHLAGGVTNIKDMANALNLPEIKDMVDKDELLGPEISIMSGFIDFAGPFAGPTGKIVKTLDEGIAAVNFYADKGYQQVKLYSSIPVEWVKPLAAQAHKRGLKVVGHIPSYMTAERAINDGYDQVIHMNMIMLNFLGDTIDTRSMGRFIKVAERARQIDTKSPAVTRFIQVLKSRQIVVDPTMAIFEGMFTNEPGKMAAGYETMASTLPPEIKRNLYRGGLPTMKGNEAAYKESYARMLEMIRLFHANGVTFLPGTDDFPGFALHRELELYAKAGVPNAEVLRKATLVSAQVAGKAATLGTIEAGKQANLILVDGDPVKNISDIRRVEWTVKNGRMYDNRALFASYGFGFWK